MLWTGIFVLNAPTLLSRGAALTLGPLVLPAWVGAVGRLGLAAASPLFLYALFNAQATGTPPGSGLAKGYDLTLAKFGNDPTWQAYNAATPQLLPTLASVQAWLRGGK